MSAIFDAFNSGVVFLVAREKLFLRVDALLRVETFLLVALRVTLDRVCLMFRGNTAVLVFVLVVGTVFVVRDFATVRPPDVVVAAGVVRVFFVLVERAFPVFVVSAFFVAVERIVETTVSESRFVFVAALTTSV